MLGNGGNYSSLVSRLSINCTFKNGLGVENNIFATIGDQRLAGSPWMSVLVARNSYPVLKSGRRIIVKWRFAGVYICLQFPGNFRTHSAQSRGYTASHLVFIATNVIANCEVRFAVSSPKTKRQYESSTGFRKPMLARVWPLIWLGALLILLLQPRHAQAQESAPVASDSPWTLGIALGKGRRTNPFVASDDVDIIAVLDVAWYGERFFFDNGDVGLTLLNTPRFSVNAMLGFNNERNYFSYLSNGSSGVDIADLRQLAEDKGFFAAGILPGFESDTGMETVSVEELENFVFNDIDSDLPERDFAVNGGLELLYLSPWGDLQAQVLSDVSGTHNGQSVWLSYAYPWVTRFAEFSFSAGLEWKSADLIDYYYGVTPSEALPGRADYAAGSGTNSVLRFAASHAFNRHWSLMGVMEREYLSSAIRKSPIINERKVDTVYVGLYYQF